MKKILSIFAIMAMLCIPFSLVSCGSDDDDSVTPSTQSALYTISVGGADYASTEAKVIKLIQEKLGKDVSFSGSGTSLDPYKMTTNNKEKVDAIIKDFGKYKSEFDNLMKEDSKLLAFFFTISSNGKELYDYNYQKNESKPLASVVGTYSYTDDNGAVWSVTITDTDAGDGKKVGSVVVPTDVNDAKAGTYEGKCKTYSTAVSFESDLTQGKGIDRPVVSANVGYIAASDAGVPVTINVNNKIILSKVMFQKK